MSTASQNISRLIRFIPASSSEPVIGEPVEHGQDVGVAQTEGLAVDVEVFSGSSVLSPGSRTGKVLRVGRILSPLAKQEVGTIRCIGLNYHNHCKEMNLAVPNVPTVFLKPSNALADPYPAPTIIPQSVVEDDAADWESELALVIGKTCKDVSEQDALDYLYGFTAANDISSRKAQFRDSQWCYSKGFDGSCPIGPAIVPKTQVNNLSDLRIQGSLNGRTVQKSGLDDLIFSVPKIISFLSQGTTLDPGTVIITGTPAGVGWSSTPRTTLQSGDEFRVFVSHGVGTLVNRIEHQQ